MHGERGRRYMGLIDDIAMKSGCEYVSELKYHPERYRAHEVLSALPVESYNEQEWCEAVAYLVDAEASYEDREACKHRLLEYFS